MPEESVACPICGKPLKSVDDRWLSAFECERCGQFTDFGTMSPSAERRRQLVRLPDPSPRPDSKDSER
jgi:endogenous inhibitor of DNA gyrase (YacG/DUF329 family)